MRVSAETKNTLFKGTGAMVTGKNQMGNKSASSVKDHCATLKKKLDEVPSIIVSFIMTLLYAEHTKEAREKIVGNEKSNYTKNGCLKNENGDDENHLDKFVVWNNILHGTSTA